MATGTVVATYNNLTGYGLLIQPIYSNSNFGPSSLIIGSFYPTRSMKANFSEIQKNIENDSEKDLGSAYRVSAAFIKVSPNKGRLS